MESQRVHPPAPNLTEKADRRDRHTDHAHNSRLTKLGAILAGAVWRSGGEGRSGGVKSREGGEERGDWGHTRACRIHR